MILEKAIWKPRSLNPQQQVSHANFHWVMAYSHKTQSFNGGQQKCLDKVLIVHECTTEPQAYTSHVFGHVHTFPFHPEYKIFWSGLC